MGRLPDGPAAVPVAAFFELLEDRFRHAKALAGSRHQDFALGTSRVRLEFAGRALEKPLTAALAHRRTIASGGPAHLTIHLWDSVTTGSPMPPPPWPKEACREKGTVHGYNDDRFRTSFSVGSGVLSMLDLEREVGFLWLRDVAHLPFWEEGAPLLNLFHWWFAAKGWQLVHGAAVGYPDGGVLLAGRGGSGKSTTALACLDSDLLYAGDDYCLLQTDPSPRVFSLYNSAKLARSHLHRLPFLSGLWVTDGERVDEKRLAFLQPHRPDQLIDGFPLKAILLPRVAGTLRTTLTPVLPAEAFKALAPSTLFQLSGAGTAAFMIMAKIVRTVPCWQIHLGTDLEELPRIIGRLLREA